MKKFGMLSIVICVMFCLSILGKSVEAYAAANSTDVTDAEVLAAFAEDASAVIVDEAGNIIEHLDVDISVTRDQEYRRDAGTTYTVTYTARSTKADSGAAGPVDGVTATGTITWNDLWGSENVLVSVSGYWTVGDETISSREVRYGARNTEGETLASFTKNPTANTFGYSPSNCTGWLFYLNTSAKIGATGNYIRLSVLTSIFT